MRASASARLDAAAADVFAVVADLTTWPRWLDVVTRAVPVGERAWQVRLGVRAGPLHLGRDVRLEATTFEPPTRLVVERIELDGRDDHSPIQLAVDVRDGTDGTDGTDVTLEAFVGKRLPFVDLQGEIARRGPAALRKLERLVTTQTG